MPLQRAWKLWPTDASIVGEICIPIRTSGSVEQPLGGGQAQTRRSPGDDGYGVLDLHPSPSLSRPANQLVGDYTQSLSTVSASATGDAGRGVSGAVRENRGAGNGCSAPLTS